MNLDEIEAVVRVMRESPRLTECEIRSGESVLRLRRSGGGRVATAGTAPVPASVAMQGVGNGTASGNSALLDLPPADTVSISAAAARESVVSHIVGVFRANRAGPTVVGETVKKGQTLGQIEAMRLMNECVAPTGGRIEAIFVHDGQPVEYGQLLFEIEPAAAGSDRKDDE